MHISNVEKSEWIRPWNKEKFDDLHNRDDNIFFAVLGDLKDSDKESNEDDNAINEYALKEIKTLNKKYFRNSNEHFFFFNRKRLYNEKEKVYMGRERKRGKIEEFINLQN